MKVPMIHILQEGWLKRAEDGTILNAHSTVTLIRSQRELILVDSGAPGAAPKICSAMNSLGIAPDEITLVINTHGHADHVGANRLFTRARFLAHTAETDMVAKFPDGAKYYLVSAAQKIDSWVEIFETPGHTPGSLSVLVKKASAPFGARNEAVVIAGDALPLMANYLKNVPPTLHWDAGISRQSIARVLTLADWVIPGHDHPFRVVQ
jgi:glyoxylase-like metal-dependent hydrolase (beta-lactamase superfamily II)